jgi:hypothetical protein
MIAEDMAETLKRRGWTVIPPKEQQTCLHIDACGCIDGQWYCLSCGKSWRDRPDSVSCEG